MYLLDDVLSALDKKTERTVVNSLWGQHGILRGKTCVLTSNDTSRFALADHLIYIASPKELHQGSLQLLKDINEAFRSLLPYQESLSEHALPVKAIQSLEGMPIGQHRSLERKKDNETASGVINETPNALPLSSAAAVLYYWKAAHRSTIFLCLASTLCAWPLFAVGFPIYARVNLRRLEIA